jgi:hypothetical protein
MTSTSIADALLHRLTFSGGGAGGRDAPAAFAFTRDFDTTILWPDVAFDTSAPDARYPLESRAEIEQIIDTVGSLLGNRAPKALAFINEHMKSALVCRSSVIAGAFSASNRELVGYCVLNNMHVPGDRVLVCTEALLHESIHQYLYKTESASGNFCDLGEGRTYASPWSGNRIPLHSLVHAALVWYGLLTLWCQLAQSSASAAEAALVRDKAATVLFGFSFICPMLASPSFPLASVEPHIVELIERMARLAEAAVSPAPAPSHLRDSLRLAEGGGWLPQLTQTLQDVERVWQRP